MKTSSKRYLGNICGRRLAIYLAIYLILLTPPPRPPPLPTPPEEAIALGKEHTSKRNNSKTITSKRNMTSNSINITWRKPKSGSARPRKSTDERWHHQTCLVVQLTNIRRLLSGTCIIEKRHPKNRNITIVMRKQRRR